jgi:hypothetical protein
MPGYRFASCTSLAMIPFNYQGAQYPGLAQIYRIKNLCNLYNLWFFLFGSGSGRIWSN